MRVGILLFEGADLLDSGGPYEVFLTASRMAEREGGAPPFDVVTMTTDGEPVRAFGGLGLVPHGSVKDSGPLDVLVVPGAVDMAKPLADRSLLDAVSALAATTPLTASVCTGAFVLAAVGILDDRPWTTHWEDIDTLAERIGQSGARRGVRWVDSGEVVTAAGLSAGIDMALHVVDRLAGRALAERTARQIDYAWEPDGPS